MVHSASLLPNRNSNISEFRFGKKRSVRLFPLGNWKFRLGKWTRNLVTEKASATKVTQQKNVIERNRIGIPICDVGTFQVPIRKKACRTHHKLRLKILQVLETINELSCLLQCIFFPNLDPVNFFSLAQVKTMIFYSFGEVFRWLNKNNKGNSNNIISIYIYINRTSVLIKSS